MYGLDDKDSENCQLFNGLKNHKLFAHWLKKHIYNRIKQRDIQDQILVDHCFWYHQWDDYYKCIGVSNGTHIQGYTMSCERRNRFSVLWNEYQDNRNRCLMNYDSSTCYARFNPKALCQNGQNDLCVTVLRCQYSNEWQSDPDNICFLIAEQNSTSSINSNKFLHMKNNFLKLKAANHKEDCLSFHQDADDGFCKKTLEFVLILCTRCITLNYIDCLIN